jgi:V/A-type H+-transporting ATPase subunit I
MPKESYKKLNEFLSEYYAAFFFKFEEKQDEVYGLYCAPESIREKIDNLFSTLYFERMHIANKASGLPSEVIQSLTRENAELKEKLAELKKDMDIIVSREFDKLCTAARSIYYLYEAFNVRKYAAHTEESFYIAGWVPESEADALAREFDAEPNVTFLLEEPDMAKHVKPPTKLKNNRFVRPFESFVRMYSLPSYNEIDPTFLFALTYSVMFGIMYGDVGHGIVLALVGYLLQRRGVFLGPILKVCGFVAALFGVFYGSAFGVEFEYSFMYKPMASGNIMKTLIAAVALGSVIIGVSMFLNMANGIKQKDAGRVLFDSNGLAGFIFYWATVIGVLSLVLGYGIITKWYVALFIVLPLALVFFKRPLSALIAKRADWAPKNKGEFILENFFELFELVLSYITNTISFIRVGAFALIHAGMMMVVFSLANVQQHSIEELNFAKVLVLIFGNVLVMGLEGLLVAIQVLRLEFYEMFSRYFSGGGNPFTPSKVSAFSKTTTR